MMSNGEERHNRGGSQQAPETETLGQKVKRLRKQLGLRQMDVAIAAEVDKSTVSRWERDEQKPRFDQTRALAGLFRVSVDEFADTNVVPLGAGNADARPIRVIAELQAGAWKEAVEWDHDEQFDVPAYLNPKMRGWVIAGYRVGGTSMNRIYPEGSIVFAAATIANGLAPQNGDRVIVQRRNKDGLYEATLKEFVVEQDGTKWLWPRSYDPEHQAPIPYRNGREGEVVVTGIVVLSQINELARRGL